MRMVCQTLLALCVASLLCGAYGQTPTISPPVIAGQVDDTVQFYCDSQLSQEGRNIALDMYDPVGGLFVPFDNSTGRLTRVDDDAIANFTFGPLSPGDNEVIVRCSLRSGQVASGNAVISVQFVPIVVAITPLDMPIALRENVSVVIQLNVSGNPQPTFTWTRVGSQMPLSNVSGVIVTSENLTFNNIGRERTGQYVYEAVNSVGRTSVSFELDVQYSPEFPTEVYSPDNLNCTRQGICASYPGIDITFRCSASGNPMPSITRVLPMPPRSNVQTVEDDIVITAVTTENAGNYSCTASSTEFPDSSVTRDFTLFVGGVAFPVSEVNVMTTNTSVIFTWEYDNGANAVPATYFIATITLDGFPIGITYVIDIDMSIFTPPSDVLSGDLTYTASFVVRNAQGDSQPLSVEFMTPPGFNSAAGLHISFMLSLLLVVCAVLAFL